MQPMKGEVEDELESESVSGSIEFRDPVTNQVFLRTSIDKAKKHLRKISQIIESEQKENAH
jgi:hypothetical protein